MSKPGPKKTPTKTLQLRGSWRGDTRKNEPKPPASTPSCPKWLTTNAKAEWRRVSKCLSAAGILTELDRAALASYCQAYADCVVVQAEIKRQGKTVATIDRTLSGIMNTAWQRLGRTEALFGMSPADRASVQIVKPSSEGKDDKSRFFDKLA